MIDLAILAWWFVTVLFALAWGPTLSDLMERRTPRLHRLLLRCWAVCRVPFDWLASNAARRRS